MEASSCTTSIELENGLENIQKNIIIPEERGASNMLNCCLVISILLLIGPFIVLDVFYFYYSYSYTICIVLVQNFDFTLHKVLKNRKKFI
jgi:hypothetical protein